MELLDLYDCDRVFTGKNFERGTKQPEGLYRLSIHVCIFNSDGKMLIQKRQPFKHGWSGLWDVSCAGSVVSGENSRQGAQRELREELGINYDFSDLRPAFSTSWKKGFDDSYVLKIDFDETKLTLQEIEVERVMWASEAEIQKMIESREFIPYSPSFIGLLFQYARQGETKTLEDWTTAVHKK